AASLDHLVGAGEQLRWDFQTKRLSCLQVNHKLELGRLHHWKVARFCALKDACNVDSHLSPGIAVAPSVTHQTVIVSNLTPIVNGWNPMTRRKSHNLTDVAAKVWIGANKHRAECTLCSGIKSF